MSKATKFLEQYLGLYSTRISDGKFTVFKNPSKKEMKEAGTNETTKRLIIRFIADSKTKTFYVWPAFEGLHIDMWKQLGTNYFVQDVQNLRIFCGSAELEGSKWVVTNSDAFEVYGDGKEWEQSFSWVSKWVDYKDYVASI